MPHGIMTMKAIFAEEERIFELTKLLHVQMETVTDAQSKASETSAEILNRKTLLKAELDKRTTYNANANAKRQKKSQSQSQPLDAEMHPSDKQVGTNTSSDDPSKYGEHSSSSNGDVEVNPDLAPIAESSGSNGDSFQSTRADSLAPVIDPPSAASIAPVIDPPSAAVVLLESNDQEVSPAAPATASWNTCAQIDSLNP